METANKCLKEWNAIIESLGKGKQTILIRNYKTKNNEFLLYPTVHYTMKEGYQENFQVKYLDFVEKNALPEKKGYRVLIKYYATLEEIIERPVSKIPSDKYYIWTREHVKRYLNRSNAFIWVLRVYNLKEPYWAPPTPGAIRYANLKEEVSLEGMEPVLSNSKFKKILNKI
jgi:restriction system protein